MTPEEADLTEIEWKAVKVMRKKMRDGIRASDLGIELWCKGEVGPQNAAKYCLPAGRVLRGLLKKDVVRRVDVGVGGVLWSLWEIEYDLDVYEAWLKRRKKRGGVKRLTEE